MSSEYTPMIQQYLTIKGQQADAILFFRLGDFYEMFFEDAKEVSRLLHITLTAREGGKGKKVPMCGFPHHASANYIARLVKHGKKVAICEQVEEPGQGKIVKREVTKIITPGTFIADELLEESVNNYIMSLNVEDDVFGLAYADISTGEFKVTEIRNKEDFISELYKISPSECLIPESFSGTSDFKKLNDVSLGAITVNEDWAFDSALSEKEIKDHFVVKDLEGFGCKDLPLATGAAGALLKYLKETQKTDLNNLDTISTYKAEEYMAMDRNSQRNLELIQNMEDLSTRGTLIGVLDHTHTPMGKRRLKKWILNPLVNTKAIAERLDAVEYLHDTPTDRKEVKALLAEIFDIERLSNKISLGTANARDMVSLAASLKNVNKLKEVFTGKLSKKLKGIKSELDDFSDIVADIENTLEEEPPVSIREGGIIRKGYNDQVDELRDLISGGKDWILSLKEREIKRTGISSLKVSFNKVFGYYIEVTKSNLDAVPEDYIRKQTLVNSERFITPELKEHESKIIGAEDRIKDLEYDIFCELRTRLGNEIDRLKRSAEAVADLDVLASLADVAIINSYTRPSVNAGSDYRVIEGRHPVLEKILMDKEFVPNDLVMDKEDSRIFIITGSNMAGKSTLIRQVALITVMAQMGSFVPAKSAEIGVMDRIFTRVGASDRLYQGMSTFMVEMLETANILNNSTERSLVILDEIGRGTSTFDGVSIAWAVVEFIHKNRRGAKVLFATHYHELTELTGIMDGIKNYNMAVQEWGEEVVFLYKLTEGSCDESFGIHVAKLAGMPKEVVERARHILENLQKDSMRGNIRSRFSDIKPREEMQLDMFDGSSKYEPIIDKLKAIDINNMTPMEALKRLSDVQKEIDAS